MKRRRAPRIETTPTSPAEAANAELSGALASPNWTIVRDAVDRAAELLRSGTLRDGELAEFGERLAALARHPKWEVRRAVARAIQHLRHATFDVAIGPLVEDDNTWVREAAERSLSLRYELRRPDVLAEQHREMLRGWLAPLEARHGRRAAADALRAAEKFTELRVREIRHEIVRVISPLDASLMNLSAALGRGDVDPEVCLKHITLANQRLALLTDTIDGLTDLFTEVTPEFRSEPLREMVEEALGLVTEGRVANKATNVVAEVTIDPSLRVDANRRYLLRAFRNILQNALDAYDGIDAPRGIFVDARAHDHRRAAVAFVDRGCGMSPEALRDAMRLHSTSKPAGMGFGLPYAQKIIETVHGGSIELASRKGEGTTVSVMLPLARDDAQEPA